MHEILIFVYLIILKKFSGSGIAKLRPVKAVNKFLKKALKLNLVKIGDHQMFLDENDSLRLLENRVYEAFQTELIKKQIKYDDVVLDLGANIGYYTLIFAKLAGQNGKIFAFEPDPGNFSLLQKNLQINHYHNVTVINKAVSDKNEKIRLYLSENNQGDHRIYDSFDDHQSVEIETIRLDDYFENYPGKINFIKMDIQGAEGGAVKGMIQLLQKNRNLKIVTEFWPGGLKRFGVEPGEFLNLLTNQGFRIYHIDKLEKTIKPINLSQLLTVYTPEKDNDTNLMFIRDSLGKNRV